MNEPIREWYRKTTARSMKWLIISVIVSSVGAALFFALVPSQVHAKIQVFNGAIVIPVAGLIWIVTFIVMWLVPMRETAFRSQESMERMESRLQELQKKAEGAITKVETAADKVTKLLDDGLSDRMEGHIKAIRDRIERDTKPIENPPRRPRPVPMPLIGESPERVQTPDIQLDLEDLERMEDPHSNHGTGD